MSDLQVLTNVDTTIFLYHYLRRFPYSQSVHSHPQWQFSYPHSLVLPVLEFPVNGITKYGLLVWRLPPNVTFLRLIQVVACGSRIQHVTHSFTVFTRDICSPPWPPDQIPLNPGMWSSTLFQVSLSPAPSQFLSHHRPGGRGTTQMAEGPSPEEPPLNSCPLPPPLIKTQKETVPSRDQNSDSFNSTHSTAHNRMFWCWSRICRILKST